MIGINEKPKNPRPNIFPTPQFPNKNPPPPKQKSPDTHLVHDFFGTVGKAGTTRRGSDIKHLNIHMGECECGERLEYGCAHCWQCLEELAIRKYNDSVAKKLLADDRWSAAYFGMVMYGVLGLCVVLWSILTQEQWPNG